MSLPNVPLEDPNETLTPRSSTDSMVETRRTTRLARSQSSSSSDSDHVANAVADPTAIITFEDLQVGGRLSLPRISLEAYILGFLLGAGVVLSPYLLLLHRIPIWRTPFFLGMLSIFHFLEFYTYARWNVKNTKADSYLTLSNGRPYIFAMTLAFLETTITSLFFPGWQARWSHLPIQLVGLVLLVVGQWMRHSAIATAGASFNHIVQRRKRDDHVLVTWGPYAWCRHPSYFGFYWWAVGSQILIGNAISTPLFAFILWKFFWNRIPSKSANPAHTYSSPEVSTLPISQASLNSMRQRRTHNTREMMWAR
jgi:protein-S-isoprenylcysteine O-methyltransferase